MPGAAVRPSEPGARLPRRRDATLRLGASAPRQLPMAMPAIGTSLFLIAIGAILRYAVTVTVSWVSLPTVGLILMIVGVAGLAISLALIALHVRRSPSERSSGVTDDGWFYR